MMGRSRRLKEIADSNIPAFSSTTGAEWWLAEAPCVHDSAPADSQEKQPEAGEHKRDVSAANAGAMPQQAFAGV